MAKPRCRPLPPPSRPVPVDDPAFTVDPALALKGRALYERCLICHGAGVVAGGFAPDLRASAVPLNPQAFAAAMQGGLQSRGMPPFPELTPEDLNALRHYIRQRARYQPTIGRTDRHGLALPRADAEDEADGLGLAVTSLARNGLVLARDWAEDVFCVVWPAGVTWTSENFKRG